ncbi:MAG: hypothetical protein ACI4TK_06120 [Agathobacter sp.]
MEELIEFFEDIIDDIFDAFFDFLGGGLSYGFGTGLWNLMISLITATIGTTPEEFSSEAWNYVTTVVYDSCLSLAASMLNIMYLIGLMRQAVKLRENYTAEMLVDALIKVIIANFGLLNGLTLMRQFFGIASTLATVFLGNRGGLYFEQSVHDLSSTLFYFLFGIIYLIVSLVCSAMIFLAVYSRYMMLYFLVGVAPFAWITLPGGSGVSNTFFSWLKTFIAKSLEVVGIAILIGIGSALCKKIDFGTASGIARGAMQAIQNMATMILLAASIKGLDITMRRIFGL